MIKQNHHDLTFVILPPLSPCLQCKPAMHILNLTAYLCAIEWKERHYRCRLFLSKSLLFKVLLAWILF